MTLHFDIFTLFPGMFTGVFDESILKRAQQSRVMSVALHNIRDYATGRHRVTDDIPYGGGGGMVMKPEPIFRAVSTVLANEPGWRFAPQTPADQPPELNSLPVRAETVPVILMSPQGRTFTQGVAQELAEYPRLCLICGRYEGVDERLRTELITEELSIGDFVISGGELAAAIVVDAVTRLLPGALGYDMAALEDSFATGLLEYPQYTRPAEFRGEPVPDILASGDHAKVARWRREQALTRTWERRPELLRSAPLSKADRDFLARLEEQRRAGQVIDSENQPAPLDETHNAELAKHTCPSSES
jgi:tRNA (guanine37-N1)-methyltransferase